MQFWFMIEGGTIDAVFVLKRLQEKYHANGKKLSICLFSLPKVSFWQSTEESVVMDNEELSNARSFG